MASFLPFAPLELGRLAEPFDHPDWVFELKYDGFRARLRASTLADGDAGSA